MAVGFVYLAPLLGKLMPPALLLIYLHTPGYMIHQVEEHQGDRFQRFVNYQIFGGLDVLRLVDILIINLPIVWGVNLCALYAALAWGAGYGLVAPYAMLVNAIIHLGASARFRSYNPGLITSAIIFMPLSIATIWIAGTSPSTTVAQHMIGLGLALAVHALIVGQSLRRFAMLRAKNSN
jgi:hypothetical protein